MKAPHKYRDLGEDQLNELFSNYLMSSWSYSKVEAFARNEKAFEMAYIFNEYGKSSASSVAGSAYHKALQFYYSDYQEGIINDIIMLQSCAFEEINSTEANRWKKQKTTPTIEDCINKANKSAVFLIENFCKEKSIYEDDIAEVLYVEVFFNEFITVNGVDIPLPCRGRIDLVIKTKSGKIVIVDHKSKSSFSDEKEIQYSIGKQAITYVIGFETKFGIKVDEVWFVENKISQNKDKSPQLNKFMVAITDDVRRLYESLLYDPLKRMISAVSDADYTYIINEADNYVDKAELYDFHIRTMISDVDGFNVEESKKDLISKRLKKIKDASKASINPNIIKKFADNAAQFIQYDLTNKDMTNEQKIEHTLRTLGTIVSVAHKIQGYSSDTYLIEVSAGTSLSSVSRYKLDIANALNVSNIRMNKDLFIYEGRSYIAVEVSKKRDKDLNFDATLIEGMKIPIGMDNFGNLIVWDLSNPSTPHVLMCGGTGSGKSVCIMSITEYAKICGVDNIIIFDPKFEFKSHAGGIIEVYNEIEEIELQMERLVIDMNDRVKNGIVRKTMVIFDEFADAVLSAKSGKQLNIYKDVIVGNFKDGSPKMQRVLDSTKRSLEENMKALLQKGRSSGFNILAALQRASTQIITGDAKVNFPVQICFKVQKEVDSNVVLDEPGAEILSGKGDGLIKSPEYPGMVRFQAFYKPQLQTA